MNLNFSANMAGFCRDSHICRICIVYSFYSIVYVCTYAYKSFRLYIICISIKLLTHTDFVVISVHKEYNSAQ